MARIPVVVLHGFLGSGKTTLLRSIITRSNDKHPAPSVLVNDMSELNVDGVLIANTDAVNEAQGNFATISGDSISSPNGVKQLHKSLKTLASQKPAWILIESSGSSHPLPLVEYFKGQSKFRLSSVITLVDATWLAQDFNAGKSLIPNWQNNLAQNTRGIENVLVEQMMFSNQILLTKSDRLDAETIQTIGKNIHPINPYAAINSVSWGNISAQHLLQNQEYNYHLVAQLTEELRAQANAPLNLSGKANQRIVAKVLEDDRPFHPERLWQTCHQHLTKGVFRSKGFFWLPTRDDVSLLWSQTNGSVGLEVVGFWRAAVLEDDGQNLTDKQRQIVQQKIDSTESRFGDRRCKLTVIGQTEEADSFIQALKDCLLTESELIDWQNGKHFADPWPQKVAKLVSN
ncbi:CobW family GTP-binding protein [Vibrio sp. LaRot3]|uniref:CobW family GTP-binding protein n=1 Tax=Vibrio sp. LaRot3 TaxID=2998829 RepID=UPI0022CE25D7|nr:GTP-binding protein [Vibrio sp. LaRot3]MDA0147900.1 GTP-binding protein [Vibrio sp. LaRot3]